jgi:hypothetical protein
VTTARRQPAKATAKKAAATKAATAKQAPATKAATATAAAKTAATRKASATKSGPTRAGATTGPDEPGSGASTGNGDTIVLTGPPGLLRAMVSVENAIDQRVALRGLSLHRSGRQTLTGSGSAVIAPGSTVEVPVSFRLETGTPPGEYPAEVEVGGIRRQALLRVEPDLSMHVSPRRTLAEVGRQRLTLTVANDGNLPIPLAAVVLARTDDGGPDPGPDVTLTLSAARTLAPGTTTVLQGYLTVPVELDPRRRHTARVPVGTTDLDVIILPRDPSE